MLVCVALSHAMPVSLQQHIVSVGKYLSAVPPAQKAAAASSQHKVLLQLAEKKSKRSADDWTAAVAAIADLPMSDQQLSSLTDVFNDRMGALISAGELDTSSRRDQQDWTKFWIGIPLDFVNSLDGLSPEMGMERLVMWLHSLGLRLPSEPTYGSIAAVHILLFPGAEKNLASSHKYYRVQEAKDEWKKMNSKAPCDAWHQDWSIEVLPVEAMPITLWNVDRIAMNQLIKSIPLRATHRGSKSKNVLQLGKMDGSDNGFNGMANVMMQQMQLMTLQALQGRDGVRVDGDHEQDGGFQFRRKRSLADVDAASVGPLASRLKFGKSYLPVLCAQRALAAASSSSSDTRRLAIEDPAEEAEAEGEESEADAVPDEIKKPSAAPKCSAIVPFDRKDKNMSLAEATQLLCQNARAIKEVKKESVKAKAASLRSSIAATAKAEAALLRSSIAAPAVPKAGSQRSSIAAPAVQKSASQKTSRPPIAARKSHAVVAAAEAPPPASAPRVDRVKQFKEHGCSKCRHKPGCTPSCWTGRGMAIPTL